MGALTLKSFPFELRGWDIEKFESIDPTDGFGISTRVYISKQQIVQIEPDHSDRTSHAWLSDKSRQFFDGIFDTFNNKNFLLKKESWQKNLKTLLKTLYLFEHCTAMESIPGSVSQLVVCFTPCFGPKTSSSKVLSKSLHP